jgi:hypothetical protein
MASATIFPPSAFRLFDERFSDVNAPLSWQILADVMCIYMISLTFDFRASAMARGPSGVGIHGA